MKRKLRKIYSKINKIRERSNTDHVIKAIESGEVIKFNEESVNRFFKRSTFLERQ